MPSNFGNALTFDVIDVPADCSSMKENCKIPGEKFDVRGRSRRSIFIITKVKTPKNVQMRNGRTRWTSVGGGGCKDKKAKAQGAETTSAA